MTRRLDRQGLFQTAVIVVGWGLMIYWLTQLPADLALVALLFAALAGFVEYVDIALPEGSVTSAVSALGIAALLMFPLPVAVASMVTGVCAARFLKERRVNVADALYFGGEASIVISLAGLLMGGEVFVRLGEPVPPLVSLDTVRVLAVCVAYFLVEVALRQSDFSLEQRSPFWPLFLGATRFLGPIYAALASIGVLMALMYPSMGIWSAALFIVLLLVTRQSFSLYLDIRKTYRGTIAALATAVEAESPQRRGHGDRVATLSIKMARELGIYGQQLEWVGYAALLHDIGKLSVDEDSFDSLMENLNVQTGDVQHAIAGAEIMQQVEFLKPASSIVRFHHRPHAAARRSRSTGDALASQIVNVASFYDQLTRSASQDERLRPREALGRVKKEQSLHFDPRVVRALSDVVGKGDGRR